MLCGFRLHYRWMVNLPSMWFHQPRCRLHCNFLFAFILMFLVCYFIYQTSYFDFGQKINERMFCCVKCAKSFRFMLDIRIFYTAVLFMDILKAAKQKRLRYRKNNTERIWSTNQIQSMKANIYLCYFRWLKFFHRFLRDVVTFNLMSFHRFDKVKLAKIP